MKSYNIPHSPHMTRFLEKLKYQVSGLNPIQHGLFWGCSRIGGPTSPSPHPKICHTYPTMVKLGTDIPYLEMIQKIYESRVRFLSSADISIFSPEISKFCYVGKYRYRFHFDS